LNKDIIKEKFLKDYLFYNIYSLNQFTNFVTEEELRMNPGNMVMCIMQIDHFKILQDRFNDEKGQLAKFAILNILNEMLSSFSRGEAFSDNDLNYILIFSFNDISSEQNLHKELHIILNNIVSTISTYLNVYVSFGISSLNNGYKLLGKMYKEAYKALEQKFFLGTGVFFYTSTSHFDKIVIEKVNTIRQQPELIKILGDSGKRDFNLKIDAFVSANSKTKEQIQIFFSGMLQWITTLLYAIDDNSADFVRLYNEKIYRSETLDEIIEAFNKYISEITDEVMKKKILSKEVAESLQFIQLNYGRDINLPQVAAHVKLSPNYLGNLFKKELQVNFIEYINELRIGKAKELLLGTYLKSYEIAERVGFTENTYFSKVFKKIVGASPNEFRKKLMKEWSEEIENEDSETV
jgi:two-component system, response regulator YesN